MFESVEAFFLFFLFADCVQCFTQLTAAGALGVGKVDDFHVCVGKNLLITDEALGAFIVGANKQIVVFDNAFQIHIAVFFLGGDDFVDIYDALNDFATLLKRDEGAFTFVGGVFMHAYDQIVTICFGAA